MLKQNDRLLADILIKNGLFTQEEANKFLTDVQSTNESLYGFLLRQGVVAEDRILQTIANSFNLPIVNLKELTVDKSVIEKIPVKIASYYQFVPIKIENKVLTLAVCVPFDVKIQDEIRVYIGLEPKLVLAKEKDIIDSLKKYYGLAAETINRILAKDPSRKGLSEMDPEGLVEDIEKNQDDASITKLVNQIIIEACQKRATDIHIEPYRHKVRIRYRIDGILVDANLPLEGKHFLLSILSRLKIMANLSIVEKRLPQDGSAIVKIKDQDIDLRISTMPTPRGESMVIRILPTKVMLFSLEKLGLDEINVRTFRKLVKKPYGLIFVTGPTGSGKTTTLYACLNEISSTEKKIITIEDPVEYEMEGVTQIQVNPRVNLTFSVGLRSILRHDPDIVMVGEVRDLETAEIAIRMALTGHLVFSSLHTNDAASGITRLIEMGLEPYLVASSVEAFVAQRLVRVICSHCKMEVATPMMDIKEEIAKGLGIGPIDQVKIYRGKGCDHCNQTGFYGRTAIYEILVMNDEIKTAILEKPRSDYIKKIAIQNGMTTLRQDGWKKVLAGVTTPMEVMNVTSQEDYLSGKELKDVDSSFYRIVSREILSAHNEYEARTYPRLDAKIEIRYKILGTDINHPNVLKADHLVHTAITQDISAGGLRFRSATSIAIGTILELMIQFEKNERSINCLSKVCRVEEDGVNQQFNIMVFYLDISSGDRVRLSAFVKKAG